MIGISRIQKYGIWVAALTATVLCTVAVYFAVVLRYRKPIDHSTLTVKVLFTWDGKNFNSTVINEKTGQEETRTELRRMFVGEARKTLPVILNRYHLSRASGELHCGLTGTAELYRAVCEEIGEGTADRFDPDAKTPLQAASAQGDIAALRQLIQQGTNVDAVDQQGNTALMRSTQLKGTGTLELLLSAGAKVNPKNREGKTALHLAVDRENLAAIRLLLASGADVNFADEHGWTPLMNATEPQVAQTLIKAGARVNARNAEGQTALMIAAQFGSPELVRTLLDSHANANLRSNSGDTALTLAASAGKTEVVDLLRRAKAASITKG